jgi:hypothetical protein
MYKIESNIVGIDTSCHKQRQEMAEYMFVAYTEDTSSWVENYIIICHLIYTMNFCMASSNYLFCGRIIL